MGRSSGGGERGSEKKAVVESQEERRGGDRTAQFTPDDLIASQHEMEKGREKESPTGGRLSFDIKADDIALTHQRWKKRTD